MAANAEQVGSNMYNAKEVRVFPPFLVALQQTIMSQCNAYTVYSMLGA